MHVHGEMDAGFIHPIERMVNFRAALRRRRVPFAVEVHACRIGAQMAATRAIRVHVGDDVEGGRLAQRTRHTVLRSEAHTSELQSLMRISYAVFCLKKKK